MQHKELVSPVLLAAGARDGDRLLQMGRALRGLRGEGFEILKVSSVYETEPVGLTGDTPLLNGAFEVAPGALPEDLLAACLRIEERLGRRRSRPDGQGPDPGARPIDLDLLLYGGVVRHGPSLTLPHPRMHLRRFVLVPLAEIAPGARHPLTGEDCATLLENCPDRAWVRRFAAPADWMSAAGSLK
ncbi:MAG: 2-amino-4-hydroxy-6-hydroxymethyldihydropteridine diphosphokinase [Candidatus Polarisedimenticolia bacterium]